MKSVGSPRSSTITHGRGSVLTIDLTNRCNMMCDPCFMDANQVGFVHELSWEEIQTMLDNAISIKPRRQMSVQFSGGEPTLSPYFLDAVRYCRKIGYQSVQAATNGIEFAKRPDFAKQAGEAGLRYAYLQFDGIGNEANSHRAIGNLFDVKLRAIENLHKGGVDIVPVITLINGVNNEQVGAVVRFANGSSITVMDAGGSEEAANKAGRGGTYHRVHCTELAHYPYANYLMEALTATVPTAERGGEFVIESTPRGVGGTYYDQWQAAVQPVTEWLDQQATTLERKPLARESGLSLLREIVAVFGRH